VVASTTRSRAPPATLVELNGRRVPTFFTYIRHTDPGANAGLPGLSLPAGLTRDGLPVGLELDGPAGSDRAMLGLGLAVERELGCLPAPMPDNGRSHDPAAA
jgi:indoleacetamide hydrolase